MYNRDIGNPASLNPSEFEKEALIQKFEQREKTKRTTEKG